MANLFGKNNWRLCGRKFKTVIEVLPDMTLRQIVVFAEKHELDILDLPLISGDFALAGIIVWENVLVLSPGSVKIVGRGSRLGFELFPEIPKNQGVNHAK